MKSSRILLTGLLLVISLTCRADDKKNPLASLHWQLGPTTGKVGDEGRVSVPKGFAFLGSQDTRKFMALSHNLSDGKEYLLAPDDLRWFATFEFDPIGYVKDDERIDAAALLRSMRESNERANAQRKLKGWTTMSITGWRFPPQYDNRSHLLEWAFMAKDDATNEPVVNYNTRLLGRQGVMSVVVVSDPARIDAAVGQFKPLLRHYEFVDGQRYAQYRPGDKIAKYGLAALIVGGAAAVAAKKGLLTAMVGAVAAAWKFLLAGFAAAAAWLKTRFGKKA